MRIIDGILFPQTHNYSRNNPEPFKKTQRDIVEIKNQPDQ